ncbi:hypothetical protein LCGC14_0513510 [marine sediment metagenome]|uniref:Uncharacterized protein n=1 Tax=marine sediment metagenome TaxID=412755 RepID=A0A0F9UM87_9ZZZZ
MSEIIYEYSKGNLLENRQHYKYTKFAGKEFLKSYINSRRSCTFFLQKKHNISGSTDDLFYDLFSDKSFIKEKKITIEGDQSNDINTEKILLDLLYNQLEKRQIYDKEIHYWLNLLTGKFEISKKLYTSYDKESFKPTIQKFDYIRNYTLFSSNIAAFCRYNKNLKFLNVLLKVNDTLSSIKERIRNRIDASLTYHSISLEIREIISLGKNSGIYI